MAGIYRIVNTANGKVYIGSARQFKERWKAHKRSLVTGKHHNTHLQTSFDKYGESAFVFEVLEITTGTTKERREVEQRYLNEYLSKWEMCYNLDKLVRHGRKSCRTSPKTKAEKISNASRKRWLDPDYRKNVSKAMKAGWTEETRKQMSERMNGDRNPMFNKEVSAETRKKISQTTRKMWETPETRDRIAKKLAVCTQASWMNPKTRKIMQRSLQGINAKTYSFINPDGNTVTIRNLTRFCAEHNLSYRGMSLVANKKQKAYKGWKLS